MGRAYTPLYLILMKLYHVSFVRIWYALWNFLTNTNSFQINSFSSFHCLSHAEIEYMQKRLPGSPLSNSVQSFRHAVGQKFVLRASLCHYRTAPIWPSPTRKWRLMHVLSARNHLQCDTLATRHPLDTWRLVLRSCFASHKHSPALFIAWDISSVHVVLHKPTFGNAVPCIENSSIERRAVQIIAKTHYSRVPMW